MGDKERFQVAKEEGKQLLQEKQYDAAIEMYLECLACASIPDKELAVIHLNIGICYFGKESHDQAIQFIDRAEKLDPSYSKSHYRKIQCLLKLKRLAEALQLCRIMLKQYPESNEFGSLLRETQTLIEIEKTSSLSYEEFVDKLSEQENNPEGLKKVFEMIFAQVDSRQLQKRILQPGGFCEELLKKANQNILQSDYCLGFLWRNVVSVRETDLKLQLSGECAEVLVSLFQKRLKSNISSTNPQQSTQGVKLLVKLLQFTSILHPSLISLFESLITYDQKIWSEFVNDLCGILQNNISNYSLDGASNDIAKNQLSEQLDKLLVQAAEMLKGISTNNNASDQQLNQDIRMLIQTLFRTLLILNPKYLDSHYFYRKEKLSRNDLLLIKELLISSYNLVSQKLIESDIHHSLCVSYLRKPDTIPYIDLILQVYSLLLSDNKFTTKVADDAAFQDFNIQLQRFLTTHKNEVAFIVKYGLLLFKINKQRKLPELLSFLRLFDFEVLIGDILMLSDKQTISEGLEFIGFMSCFDQFKVQLVESQKQFLSKLTLKVDFQLYDQGLSWLITISNLCFDQLRDFEEKQKEKFGLSDEKLEEFKQFEEKYRKDDKEQAKDIFRYNEEFIQKNNVVKYLLEDVQIIKYLVQFLKLQSSQENKNSSNRSYSSNNQLKQSDLFLEYFSQLLSKLVSLSSSQDKGNSPSAILFNTTLIYFAASALNQTANASLANSHLVVLHLAQYLGKTLKDANPQLFNYQEVHAIVDALFKGLRVSSHELLSFELLLSLVQMTSRGQETTSKLVNSNTLTLLQNLLVEDENQYIIHATLEVLNNICLNDKMMERIGSMPTLIQLIFAHFEASFSRLLDQKPEDITNNYNEPIKILSTIYNILAINSTTEQFKVKANGHLCSSPDTLVLLLQKYAKNNGYLRMEFLYKFIFMTQSFRQKKLTTEEKSMLNAIYADVKKQYKKECKGNIPKNDTRFEYMDAILS